MPVHVILFFLHFSKSLSKSSLASLKCVANVFAEDRKLDPNRNFESTPAFAKLISRLVYGVQGKKVYEIQARKALISILSQLATSELFNLIAKLHEVDKNLVCLSIIYNWMKRGGNVEIFDEGVGKSSQAVVDLYIKEFLMTKLPKPAWVLENVSKNLLPCLSDIPECLETIIATITKALLRSPETAIEVS